MGTPGVDPSRAADYRQMFLDNVRAFKAKQEQRKDQEFEHKANTILDDVQKIKARQQTVSPNTPEAEELQKQLDLNEQAFRDLFHPVKNPGALAKLGSFLKQRLTGKAPAPRPQSNEVTPQRLSQLEGAATGNEPTPKNPYQLKYEQLKAIGLSDEDARRVASGEKEKPHKTVTSIEPDPQSPTGYSKVISDQETGEELSRQTNVLPPRGFVGSESTTTDPFGQKTTTERKPVMPGTGPQAPNKVIPGEVKKKAATTAPSGHQLDAQGHIPATAKVNPQLREAANQILDGMDIEKLPIPQKDRAAAAQLAREYGWAGQGLFSPKDKLLIRESTAILKQLASSTSLSVLDHTASRLKIQQVLQDAEKRNMFGQAFQSIAAQGLSPEEQEFVTLYNQAVGRISGLAQLVRSGRATEAQINRLKTELPNPATTTNSAHARQKLQQIQNEIDIALEKGQFTEGSGDMSDDEFLKKIK